MPAARAALPLALFSVAALAGCGTPCMRPADPGEVLEAPPEGKALLNVHRPSGFAGGVWYSVFDGTTLAGVNKGGQRFQYVCDPGKHVLIGRSGAGGAISVVRADVEADRIYDLVVDVAYDFWTGWAPRTLVPITRSEERRSEVPTWEASEQVLVVDTTQKVAAWEDSWRAENERAVKDFDGGSKKDRLLYLTAPDARD
ncbi:MAG: hypothetical protein D6731_05850 [Planctomycetota bacterium]|nr:MAG: hypothetical protein D6731_05850 [Planctomycetota bacterium]